MKILFLTTEREDYLQDAILHGFRSLLGSDLIDYPQKKILYKPFKRIDTYGRGFTLYNLLDNIEVDRNNIELKLKDNIFDLVIFGSIQRQGELFLKYKKYINKDKTIIMDGEDAPIFFPNHHEFKKLPFLFFKKRVYNEFKYYKREFLPQSNHYRFFKLLPTWVTNKIPFPKNIFPISFAIPIGKVVQTLPIKTKLFPKHIVDQEVAANVEGSLTKYAFEDEDEYYTDLQSSKFGITTKRAGWDCMRHYEIAANGTVICFKDLDKKPKTCAPHGLIPGVNCISYKNYEDLILQISITNDQIYNALQLNSMVWIKKQTTIYRVQELLHNFNLKKIKIEYHTQN